MEGSDCNMVMKEIADSALSAASCGCRGLGACDDGGFGGFGSEMEVDTCPDTPVWAGSQPAGPFKTGWEDTSEPELFKKGKDAVAGHTRGYGGVKSMVKCEPVDMAVGHDVGIYLEGGKELSTGEKRKRGAVHGATVRSVRVKTEPAADD